MRLFKEQTVIVVIRTRPLNQRELGLNGGETCVEQLGPQQIQVEGGEATPRGTGPKSFDFDVVLGEEGTAEETYERTAKPILSKVLEGFNGCIFAYGQTGSGKTFTMQGSNDGTVRGITAMLCEELFASIERMKEEKHVEVVASYVEIYNEKLKDLLLPDGAPETRRGLQLYEEKLLGGGRAMFIKGVRELEVESYEDVEQVLREGQMRRSVGETKMNAQSSRSHAVLTLRLTSQRTDDPEGVTKTTCKLNLVDLAGSERQKKTGAEGAQLREGANINLSLSMLGNVINALTSSSSGGKGGELHVPYRNSKLTHLLQDSLGGNSYTTMICNISPSSLNADETISSLRFAERAKKVVNKATVNQDPQGARIAELLEENGALKKRMAALEAHIKSLEEYY